MSPTVTTNVRCCFRSSRCICFHGSRRSRYGDVFWFRVRILDIQTDGLFFFKGANNLSNSFWFLASTLAKSEIISFLKDVFISSRFSGSTLGVLRGPATRSFSLKIFGISEFFKETFFVVTKEQFDHETVTKFTAQYYIFLHIYTFQASFVPHLKTSRYHKNQVCSSKSGNDSNYFSPASKKQVIKFLVASLLRKLCWNDFCSGNSISCCSSKLRQNKSLVGIFISVCTPAWSISQFLTKEIEIRSKRPTRKKLWRNRNGAKEIQEYDYLEINGQQMMLER